MNYTILITQNCNLNCKYCYEVNKNRSEQINVENLNHFIKLIVKEHQNNIDERISINICGGEPLLAIDKIKYLMDNLAPLKTSRGVPAIAFSISTNGTLITEELLEYLKKFDCSFFIGFDGIKESFDRNRIFYDNNKGAFLIVYNNIKKMLANGIHPELITLNQVIFPNNIEFLLDNVNLIESLNNKLKISFNIGYNSEWTDKELMLLDKKIKELLKFYNSKLINDAEYSITLIDSLVKNILLAQFNSRSSDMSRKCGAGKGCMAVLTNGEVVGCGGTSYYDNEVDKITIGNVKNGIDEEKLNSYRNIIDKIDYSSCKECELMGICNNYCIVNNLIGCGKLTEIPRQVCEIEKILIFNTMNFIKELKIEYPDIFEKKYAILLPSYQETQV